MKKRILSPEEISHVQISSKWTLASTLSSVAITALAIHIITGWETGAVFIFTPYILTLLSLAILRTCNLGERAHEALSISSGILFGLTFLVYLPAIDDSGGCMAGMIFGLWILLAIAFPLLYLICWALLKPMPATPK